MRKNRSVLACLALAGLAAAGCSVEEREKEVQVVTLGLSGPIGTRGWTVGETFAETAGPTGPVVLRLEGDGGVLEVTAGESVEIPVGSYRVTGLYEPESVSYSGDCRLSAEPRLEVDCELEVRKGTEYYDLPCSYGCWALLQEEEYVSGYKVVGKYLDLYGTGVYKVAYVWPGESFWQMTVVPSNGDVYDETEVTVEQSMMENGRWYSFRPGRFMQSGGLWFDFPEWLEGVL